MNEKAERVTDGCREAAEEIRAKEKEYEGVSIVGSETLCEIIARRTRVGDMRTVIAALLEWMDNDPVDWTDTELGNFVRKNWAPEARALLAGPEGGKGA